MGKTHHVLVSAHEVCVLDLGVGVTALNSHMHIPAPAVLTIIDSGASVHMFADSSLFDAKSWKPAHATVHVAAKGTTLAASKQGTVKLYKAGQRDVPMLTLVDVLFLPGLSHNLISVSALAKDLCQIHFAGSVCQISRKGKVLLQAKLVRGDLYSVPLSPPSPFGRVYAMPARSLRGGMSLIDLLHQRHAHAPERVLRIMYTDLPVHVHLSDCNSCVRGKSEKAPFSKSRKPTVFVPLGQFVADLSGKGPVESRRFRNVLFALIVDVFSGMYFILFHREKSQFIEGIQTVITREENQMDRKLKSFHADGAGENVNTTLGKFFEGKGIVYTFTTRGSSNANPIAEAGIKYTRITWRVLLDHANMPPFFWEDAATHSVYLHNLLYKTRLLNRSPLAVYHIDNPNYKPDLHYTYTFGCLAEVLLAHPSKWVASRRTEACIFLGASAHKKGGKFYSLERKVIIEERSAYYFENIFPFRPSIPRPVTTRPTGIQYTPSHIYDSTQDDDHIIPPLPQSPALRIREEHSETNTKILTPRRSVTPQQYLSPPASMPSLEQDPTLNRSNVLVPPIPSFSPAVSHSPSPRELHPRFSVRRSSRTSQPTGRGLESSANTPLKRSSTAFNSNGPSIDRHVDVDRSSSNSRAKTINNADTDPSALVALFVVMQSLAADAVAPPTDPLNRKEAMASPDFDLWLKAEEKELSELAERGTWEVVDIMSATSKPIGCRWVYKYKLNDDNSIKLFKARLCALGFLQRYGIDFLETFAAVALMKSLRCLLAIAVQLGLRATQLDVKNAFVQATLKEIIFMNFPPGYPGPPGKVLRLIKSIYGLKQASREFQTLLVAAFKKCGFLPIVSDTCVFIHTRVQAYMLTHVDDFICFTANETLRTEATHRLNDLLNYQLKELGRASIFTGINIVWNDDSKSVKIHQGPYINRVLRKFGMENGKSVDTPHTNYVLSSLDSPLTDEEKLAVKDLPYRSLVGSALWPAMGTRPDIIQSVISLAMFNHNWGQKHWQAGKRVLRYLKGHPDLGITYTRDPTFSGKFKARLWSDSDWGSDTDSRRSRSGLALELLGGLLTWASKMQKTVALSSCEAEYMAIAEAVKDVLWFLNFMAELKLEVEVPVPLYIDNMSAIHLAENPVSHQRSKHIDMRYKFIRENVVAGVIVPLYVPTGDNIADIFTKNTTRTVFQKHVQKIVS
jgi:hypothetical protein